MDREKMLEKFTEGKLTTAEQKEFDRLYDTDLNFRTEVDFHTNISRVAEAEDDDAFREMLTSFEAEALLTTKRDDKVNNAPPHNEIEAKSKKTGLKRLPARWLVAASIALIAGLAYIFMPASPTSNQDLFNQNFQPYPNVVHPVVRGEEGPELKTKAFVAYEKKEYTSAIALFAELYSESEEPDYLFYQANALLQLNRGQEAIPLLQNHLESGDKLAEKSAWYLAMAYLQVDDSENAQNMLQSVVDDGGFKAQEAKKLLKSLH